MAQAKIDRLEAELAQLRASLDPPSSPPPSPPPSSAAGSSSGVVWWHVVIPVLSVAALVAVLFVLHRFSLLPRTGRLRSRRSPRRRRLPRWLRQITDGLEEASSSVFARERAGVVHDIAAVSPADEGGAHGLLSRRDSSDPRRAHLLELLERLDGGGGGLGPRSASHGEAGEGAACAGASADIDRLVARTGSLDAALVAAVSQAGSAGDVAALLQRGASPHSALLGSGPVLSLAARGCSAEVSRLLLSAGADPDGKDSRGWTPLMHAIDAHSAAAPREQVVRVLLSRGAAVDVWTSPARRRPTPPRRRAGGRVRRRERARPTCACEAARTAGTHYSLYTVYSRRRGDD